MNKYILMLFCALAACSCDVTQPNIEMKTADVKKAVSTQENRVSVERIGVFKDNIAYYGTRGVYVIHDNETNTDFIGVSGVGISEVGRHILGKVSIEDEK